MDLEQANLYYWIFENNDDCMNNWWYKVDESWAEALEVLLGEVTI